MFRLLLTVILLVLITSGCGKKENEAVTEKRSSEVLKIEVKNLIGSWVNKESEMGFQLMDGGKAASVNMATLDYNSWQLIENKIILNSTSKGVSNPVTTDEIYVVKELTPFYMILSPSNNPGTNWKYEKR